MAYQELQILKLSDTGEVSRRIRCLQGRVTVFRARSESELDSYRKALRGENTKEKFSVLLDDSAFRMDQHNFVGFSEPPFSSTERLSEYLGSCGADLSSIDSWLLEYGLGGMGVKKLSDLTLPEQRIARILGATCTDKKILVLNDPFDIIPERWRDHIAELLVRYAWHKKAIVIVTKLSYRPKPWVENDFVTRVQLERTRSMTIGFGSGVHSTVAILETVRGELKKQGATSASYSKVSSASEQLLMPNNSTQRSVSTTRLAIISAGFIVLGGAALLAFPHAWLIGSESSEETVAQAKANLAEDTISLEPKVVSIMDLYPGSVASSILKAFDTTMPIALMTESPLPQYPPLEKSAIIPQLAANNPNPVTREQDSGKSLAEIAANPETPEKAELEREKIRQRFLEAVAQAEKAIENSEGNL